MPPEGNATGSLDFARDDGIVAGASYFHASAG
jgi:hypothetical protein